MVLKGLANKWSIPFAFSWGFFSYTEGKTDEKVKKDILIKKRIMKNELTRQELDLLKTAKPNMKSNAFLSNAEKRDDKKIDKKEIKKNKDDKKV